MHSENEISYQNDTVTFCNDIDFFINFINNEIIIWFYFYFIFSFGSSNEGHMAFYFTSTQVSKNGFFGLL
jgi:hypothetical protein